MTERTYEFPRWRVRAGQAGILFICSMGAIGLAAGEGPWWFYAASSGVLLAFVWWALVRFPRRQVVESREGLLTWNLILPGSRVVAWSEIERFVPTGPLVEAIQTNGRYVSIIGLDAGARRTRWRGAEPGETDDIVAELNRRLHLWRVELGLDTAR